MMEHQQSEPDVVVEMRTHLTVANLALAQLRRRHGDTPDIDRLCAYAERAIVQLKDDIASIEATLAQHERRDDHWQELRSRPPRITVDAQNQETGPIDLPSPIKPPAVTGEKRRAHRSVDVPRCRTS
jgi:hypothetical protein